MCSVRQILYHTGVDDYLDQVSIERLSSERPILWNHHGIEISSQVAIPDDQEVKVRVNIYDASKPEFSFPEGFSTKSYVYKIRVATTHESLISGIQITLTNFPRPQGREFVHVLEASNNPTKWGANFAPEFRFSQVEESRFQLRGSVKIAIRSTTCYLVIAGKSLLL